VWRLKRWGQSGPGSEPRSVARACGGFFSVVVFAREQSKGKAMSKSDIPNESAVREDIDALKDDLKSIRSDMQGLLKNLGTAGHEGVRRAKETASEAAARTADAAVEQGRETAQSFDSQVRSHPYTACGVAFFAGAMATLVLCGRK